MKQFAHSTLRFTLTAIGLILAGVSAYLTAIYLYRLGEPRELGTAFSIAGFLLDAAKTIFPVCCLIAWSNGKKIEAVIGLVLATALMWTSFNISVYSLELSINDGQKTQLAQSENYKNQLAIIEQAKRQLSDLQVEKDKLLESNYLTKAGQLNKQISDLNYKVMDLTSKLSTLPKTTSEGFSRTSVTILSGLIELTASVALILASSLSRSTAQPPAPKPAPVLKPAPKPEEKPLVAIEKEVQPVISFDDEEPAPDDYDLEALPELSEAIISQAKVAISKGEARPSERSLSDALGVKRPEASRILNFLEEQGFLSRNGRQRVLATE